MPIAFQYMIARALVALLCLRCLLLINITNEGTNNKCTYILLFVRMYIYVISFSIYYSCYDFLIFMKGRTISSFVYLFRTNERMKVLLLLINITKVNIKMRFESVGCELLGRSARILF